MQPDRTTRLALGMAITAAALALGACTTATATAPTAPAGLAGDAPAELANQTGAMATDSATAPMPATAALDYDDPAHWLCHPGKAGADACNTDLSVTVIETDNSTRLVGFEPAGDPGFDCFYYYPTVSLDESWNSDAQPGPEEFNVIANQFARFGAACRLFAPVYRQRTLKELRNRMATGEVRADVELRYRDVLASWQHYMREENDGRGVILIGHSQGARMVAELLERHVLGSADRDQLIAAYIIGASGPAFDGLPPCTSGDQSGCLVNYVTFRADAEPPATSRFGLASDTGQRAHCTNPADLDGSGGALKAILPARRAGMAEPYDYGVSIDTPFVALPGLLTAECRSNASHDWLAVTVNADPGDPRTDTLYGDVIIDGAVQADWGLHLIDVNVAAGNLIALAAQQGQAWLAGAAGE